MLKRLPRVVSLDAVCNVEAVPMLEAVPVWVDCESATTGESGTGSAGDPVGLAFCA
jgi:hypothetical protein